MLIIFLFSSIFINNKYKKQIALALLIFFMFRYMTGYKKCFLTEIEHMILKKKYKEGFIYRLLKPYFNMPEYYFKKRLFIVHVFYIIILMVQLNKST